MLILLDSALIINSAKKEYNVKVDLVSYLLKFLNLSIDWSIDYMNPSIFLVIRCSVYSLSVKKDISWYSFEC